MQIEWEWGTASAPSRCEATWILNWVVGKIGRGEKERFINLNHSSLFRKNVERDEWKKWLQKKMEEMMKLDSLIKSRSF